MTIRASAYETTALSLTSQKDILAILRETTSTMNEEPQGVFSVQGRTSFESNIPTFVFPIIDMKIGAGHAFVDVRSYGTFDPMRDNFRVRSLEQIEAQKLHGSLALSWARMHQSTIEFMSILPMAVYMTWLGESIAKRMNLSGRDQYTVTILAAVMYFNHHRDEMTDDDRAVLLNTVTRTLRYNDAAANQGIINTYHWVNDVDSFCKACYEATQSVSLKNLNPSILFTLVGGSMWGSNASEKLAAALEYPPTWITLLFQVITDRSYRGRCQLSSIVERNTYRKYAEEFTRKCLTAIENVF